MSVMLSIPPLLYGLSITVAALEPLTPLFYVSKSIIAVLALDLSTRSAASTLALSILISDGTGLLSKASSISLIKRLVSSFLTFVTSEFISYDILNYSNI